MKLSVICNSEAAWRSLSAVKKPPKLAYRLMKYTKLVSAEIKDCEEQRAKYVCEIAGVEFGTEDGAQTFLLPGTPQHDEFMAKFQAFLDTESDLLPVPISMEALIDSLGDQGNVISETDLANLEPFFVEKPATDLKLVKSEG